MLTCTMRTYPAILQALTTLPGAGGAKAKTMATANASGRTIAITWFCKEFSSPAKWGSNCIGVQRVPLSPLWFGITNSKSFPVLAGTYCGNCHGSVGASASQAASKTKRLPPCHRSGMFIAVTCVLRSGKQYRQLRLQQRHKSDLTACRLSASAGPSLLSLTRALQISSFNIPVPPSPSMR